MVEGSFKDIERTGWHERANAYEDTTALSTIQSIPTPLAAVKLRPRTDFLDICTGPEIPRVRSLTERDLQYLRATSPKGLNYG